MLAHESVEAALDFVIVELEARAQKIRGLIDARSQHVPAAGARTEHRGRGDESTMGAKGFETSRQHVRDRMRYREYLCVAQLSEDLTRGEAGCDHRCVRGRAIGSTEIDQDRAGLRGDNFSSARRGA